MSEIRADKLHNASGDNDSGLDLSTNDQVIIKTANSERARVDANGVFYVGTTDDDPTFNNSTGVAIGSNNGSALAGVGQFSCNGGVAVRVNRTNEKGASIGIHSEGTQRATLGTVSTADVYFGCDRGAGLRISDQELIPCNATGAFNNDAVDLGHPSSFFDDIRATNGTIQTSDQQEKNTIEDSDLGLDFVKRLSPKSYIFNGKTRTHYGLIAQDVETVLSDINKPTSGFAGFIKDDVSEEQDGSSYRYGLRYTEFVAPLIKAIKEQQTIIEDLQARITALENAE